MIKESKTEKDEKVDLTLRQGVFYGECLKGEEENEKSVEPEERGGDGFPPARE
jgi:hypothetical protein